MYSCILCAASHKETVRYTNPRHLVSAEPARRGQFSMTEGSWVNHTKLLFSRDNTHAQLRLAWDRTVGVTRVTCCWHVYPPAGCRSSQEHPDEGEGGGGEGGGGEGGGGRGGGGEGEGGGGEGGGGEGEGGGGEGGGGEGVGGGGEDGTEKLPHGHRPQVAWQ